MRAVVVFAIISTVLNVHGATAEELPPGPGKDLLLRKCTTCHDISMLTATGGMSQADWEATLDDMKAFGAQFTADERRQMLEYLVANLGPKQK
jgi:hypothetical protein